MIDVHMDMPHAIVLQRLTGVPSVTFDDLARSVQAQGIEPVFLQDRRVIRLALDDLISEGYVGVLGHPAELALKPQGDWRYTRLNDPAGGR